MNGAALGLLDGNVWRFFKHWPNLEGQRLMHCSKGKIM